MEARPYLTVASQGHTGRPTVRHLTYVRYLEATFDASLRSIRSDTFSAGMRSLVRPSRIALLIAFLTNCPRARGTAAPANGTYQIDFTYVYSPTRITRIFGDSDPAIPRGRNSQFGTRREYPRPLIT